METALTLTVDSGEALHGNLLNAPHCNSTSLQMTMPRKKNTKIAQVKDIVALQRENIYLKMKNQCLHFSRFKVPPLFQVEVSNATYHHLMDKIFKDQIGRNMEVYVNDMMVKYKPNLMFVI